jgi:hypothetical protein
VAAGVVTFVMPVTVVALALKPQIVDVLTAQWWYRCGGINTIIRMHGCR